jgi:hypothetical protein
VDFLRSLFAERVLTHPMVKSTAVSDAGLTKQTLYEVGRENFSRGTYDRWDIIADVMLKLDFGYLWLPTTENPFC